ncbi:hypothetical protein IWQ61_001905 [Dispira simplex]|nr:hypothetical protein IWQ61_001905 [Dispira simplex]
MASSSHSRPDRQTLDESHDGNHRTSTHLPAFLLGRRHSTSNNSGGKLRRHLLRERLSQIFRPGRSRSNTSYARPNRSGSPVPRTVAHSHTSSTPSIPENVQSVTTNQEHNEQESSLQTPAESPAFPPQHQSDYSQTGEEEQDNLSQLSMSLCSCSDLESHLDYPSPAPPIFPR